MIRHQHRRAADRSLPAEPENIQIRCLPDRERGGVDARRYRVEERSETLNQIVLLMEIMVLAQLSLFSARVAI